MKTRTIWRSMSESTAQTIFIRDAPQQIRGRSMSRTEIITRSSPQNEIYDDLLTNGIIGPSRRMLGPVADGGKITFLTSPGCWGPMITPTIRGGHAVCTPVAVENADVGDAIAIRVEGIKILSKAASSGVDSPKEGYFIGDAAVAKKCPSCGELWPEFVVEGTGQEAIRCKNCGGQSLHSR